MRFNLYATRLIVAIVAIAITLPACTTAQLQKQYTSFDVCFREQKVIAMTVGAIGGALIGNAIGGNSKQKTVAAVGLAALGGVIGNRIAWESCLKAFSPRSQTTLVTARATSTPLAPPTSGGAPSAERYLTIQSVTARPLVLGRDLEVSAQYIFVSDKPSARDVKARVSRILLFTAPDGSRQEIASATEDTIQQGTSRTNFAIPTPSAQDAPELAQTSDWAVKFVVEVDGMRQELVTPLQVPQLQQASSVTPPQVPQQAPLAPPSVEQVRVPAGTVLVSAPSSTRAVVRAQQATSARVLQRSVINSVVWLEVEMADGKRGWIRGARQ